MTRAPRSYHSPLREAQARRTRELILDTLLEMVASDGPHEVSTRGLATRAGVSERTVYRYFPDRAALLDGLDEVIVEAAGWLRPDTEIADLHELAAEVRNVFADFDERPEETAALVLLNADPAHQATATRERTDRFAELVDADLPELGETDRACLHGLIRTLVSSQTWLRMRELHGLDGETSGAAVAWAVEALVAAALRDGRIAAVD